MDGENGLTIVVQALVSAGWEREECGCCGSRFVPKRVRMALAMGNSFRAEICGDCVLRGPAGAAKLLRERIRERESSSLGGLTRTRAGALRSWSGWMERRAAALEQSRAFPLEARQAALRELREKR